MKIGLDLVLLRSTCTSRKGSDWFEELEYSWVNFILRSSWMDRIYVVTKGFKIIFSIQNYHQLIKPTPVSTHFNQPGHSIDHLLLTALELIHNTRDSVRKAREAHLTTKAMTLELLGINRRDEQN